MAQPRHEIECGTYRLTRADSSGQACIEVDTNRKLTAGEIQMAKSMFQESIDYSRVLICRGGLFHNITGNARTLGYEITLPSEYYESHPDFSLASVRQTTKNWYIHEMAHVWQYERGYNTFNAGASLFFCGEYFGSSAQQNGQDINKPIAYQLDIMNDDEDFPNYNMEQQAEIIAHYFDISKLKSASIYYPYVDRYYECLRSFISDPFNSGLLPR